MGNSTSSTNERPEYHIWVLGKRGAGKSTLIDAIKFNGDTTKTPTEGFKIEQYVHRSATFTFREFGKSESIVQHLTGDSNLLELYGSPQCIWYVARAEQTLQQVFLDLNTLLYTLKIIHSARDIGDPYEHIPVAWIINKSNEKATISIYDDLQKSLIEAEMDPEDVRWSRKATQLDQLGRTLRLNQFETDVYMTEISFTDNTTIQKLMDWSLQSMHSPTKHPYKNKGPLSIHQVHFVEPISYESSGDSDDFFLG